MTADGTDFPLRSDWRRARRVRRRRLVGWIATGSALVAVGFLAGRLFADRSSNLPWLGTFVTSPGLGGLAAVFAAIIALAAALFTSRRSAAVAAADRAQRERLADEDRHQRELADQRAQWWTRFTWAADRAVRPETSELGISVLSELIDQDWVTVEDNEIAIAVADVIQPPTSNIVDTDESIDAAEEEPE